MKSYSPGEISVIVDGAIISGFAEGTFINVARDEDSSTFVPSATGGGSRTKNANRAGKFTFTLQQTSESNQILSDLVKADEDGENVLVPVLVRDNSGADLHKAEQVFITKPADAGYAKDLSDREWILQAEVLEMNLGGN